MATKKYEKKLTIERLEIFLLKNGIDFVDAKNNKNFEAVKAGCELHFLTEDDVLYMLKETTSEVRATNRLIARRREFFAD